MYNSRSQKNKKVIKIAEVNLKKNILKMKNKTKYLFSGKTNEL